MEECVSEPFKVDGGSLRFGEPDDSGDDVDDIGGVDFQPSIGGDLEEICCELGQRWVVAVTL